MIDDIKKEFISLEVIKTLKLRFDNFPNDISGNRNAPFHEAFLKAFSDKFEGKVQSIPIFISLSSWMHGLNTTLGQSFFENVAHILCNGEKRTFKNNKIFSFQKSKISEIITELKNGNRKPNLEFENEELFKLDSNDSSQMKATDFTSDVFFESNKEIVAVELKTVKPNSGVFKVEKEKILEAKLVLKNLYPQKDIKYFLGFPFDPQDNTATGFDKERFMDYSIDFRKYFEKKEFLISSELWDFLSGERNTMEIILEIINRIATPEFLDKFYFISEIKNFQKDSSKFIKILEQWSLQREKKLILKNDLISEYIKDNQALQKIYFQNLFKEDGIYNEKRLLKLFEMLEN